jgi:DNA-binding MarR family transcriptional regulator
VGPRAAELKLDNQLCFALYDASRAFTRAYAPMLGELGLTYPQYLVMLVLWETEDPMFMSDLGERLHLDSGTLSPLLRRLDQQGLVQRCRDSVDERRVQITLTAAGRELSAGALEIPARIFEACGVDPAGGVALRDSLIEIARSLERAGAQPESPLSSA